MTQQMTRSPWYPQLADVTHPAVADALRLAYDRLYALQQTMTDTHQTTQDNFKQLNSVFGSAALRKQLQAGGDTPLNVQGLLGRLAQPQIGGIGVGTAIPSVSDPLSQLGAMFAVTPANVIYFFDGNSWVALAATAKIAYGLRSATPTAGNAGYLYYQTDTGWLYYDNGSSYLYSTGTNWGTDAARATITVAAADNGALFYTTDNLVLWRVEAGAWASKLAYPKVQSVTTGSIGASASAAVTLTWTVAFADANYGPQASVVEATATTNTLRIHHIESFSATQVVVRVVNDDAGGAHTGTLWVTGVHT